MHLAGNDVLSLRALKQRGHRIRARLVVLSACETGLVGELVPDEAVGLPTGLLYAGARTVVASSWAVPDESTTLLMEYFYDELFARKVSAATFTAF